MPVSVAVIKESLPGERRVALDPGVVQKLMTQGGFEFRLQQGAGLTAGFPDSEYESVSVFNDFESTVAGSDIVLMVNPPDPDVAQLLPVGSLLATSLFAHANIDLLRVLLERKITAMALELMPRVSRAHSMNITSSQGTIAGYKAALLAAELSPRLWPMVTTPAGTVKPSTVVVIGAGTAGLQAIATARRLGARVEAYDIRPSAREQVESLGASMIETGFDVQGTSGHGRALNEDEKEKQHEILADVFSRAHAVICTAALPGRAAPRIVTADMVDGMPRGAVIVDMAARSGGNCELTEAGKTIWREDKRIVGSVDLAGAASVHSSELYSRNMFHLLKFLIRGSTLLLDFEDQIIEETVLTHEGRVLHASTAELLGIEPAEIEPESTKKSRSKTSEDTTADWVETDDPQTPSGPDNRTVD